MVGALVRPNGTWLNSNNWPLEVLDFVFFSYWYLVIPIHQVESGEPSGTQQGVQKVINLGQGEGIFSGH